MKKNTFNTIDNEDIVSYAIGSEMNRYFEKGKPSDGCYRTYYLKGAEKKCRINLYYNIKYTDLKADLLKQSFSSYYGAPSTFNCVENPDHLFSINLCCENTNYYYEGSFAVLNNESVLELYMILDKRIVDDKLLDSLKKVYEELKNSVIVEPNLESV